ncbi:MAG: hypothetical protein OXI71_06095 [Gemmatimonadota bacterium]|nr:hypothetical protein [Gemmatimonadota bacterium]
MSKPHPAQLRHPVGVSVGEGANFVVCNDGAVFQLALRGWWKEVAPIPGSQRALEVQHRPPRLLDPQRGSTLPRAASEP